MHRDWIYRIGSVLLLLGCALAFAPLSWQLPLLALLLLIPACFLGASPIFSRWFFWCVTGVFMVAVLIGYFRAHVYEEERMLQLRSASGSVYLTGSVRSIGSSGSGEYIRWCTLASGCVRVGFSGRARADLGESFAAQMTFRAPSAPFDRIFDARGMRLAGQVGAVIPTASPEGLIDRVFSLLYRIKSSLQSELDRLYPEDHSALMRGMLIGDDRWLRAPIKSDFQRSGLQHLMVASGTNVTIVLCVLAWMFAWLPSAVRFVLLCVCIAGFTIIAGAEPPILRASALGVLTYLITLHGGRARAGNLLLLFVTIMVLIRPTILLYDAGFALSCLAVLGLIVWVKPFERFFYWVPSWLGLRQIFIISLSASLATLPVLVWVFEQLSLTSIAANILAAPLVGIVMIGSLASMFLEWLSPSVGALAGLIPYLAADTILRIAHIFGSPEWAVITFHFWALRPWIQGALLLLTAIGLLLATPKNPSHQSHR